MSIVTAIATITDPREPETDNEFSQQLIEYQSNVA